MKQTGRVLVGALRPAELAQAVSRAFGKPLPALQHRILIKGGKRLASTCRKVHA